jgi:hypothetical protein
MREIKLCHISHRNQVAEQCVLVSLLVKSLRWFDITISGLEYRLSAH